MVEEAPRGGGSSNPTPSSSASTLVSEASSSAERRPLVPGGQEENKDRASVNLSEVHEDALPWTVFVSYGLGFFGPTAQGNISTFFHLFFLTNVAGIDPNTSGAIVLAGRIWNAVCDPIIGAFGDVHQQWHMWSVWGSLLSSFFFVLMWVIPPWNLITVAAFYMLASLLHSLFYSLYFVPVWAVHPLLSTEYHERTRLSTIGAAFTVLGLVLSLWIAVAIFDIVQDPVTNFYVLGLVIAILSAFATLAFVGGTREHLQVMKMIDAPKSSDVQEVFENKPFMLVTGALVTGWTAIQLVMVILPYYVVNYLKLRHGAMVWIAITYESTMVGAVFVWYSISRKLGKKGTYFLGTSLAMFFQVLFLFITPENAWLCYVLSACAGSSAAAWFAVLNSMQSDTTDYHELKFHARRQGLLAGVVMISEKIGATFGMIPVWASLSWFGFQSTGKDEYAEQPEKALMAIRVSISIVPGVLMIMSMIFAAFYPITEESHRETLRLLEQRKKEEEEASRPKQYGTTSSGTSALQRTSITPQTRNIATSIGGFEQPGV